ncbi:MAG TPA: RNA polymerase subunit sigma-24 [Verrucomicrobiales bacterium]|nr:RNA polymerase subunit sigma-24 [Verrucomicrobiales bacterium]
MTEHRESTHERHLQEVQALFIQHTPALRGFVLALMPDFGRVDDVLQETFLLVTRKAGEFKLGSNFLGWACTIARFKVLEIVRRETRRQLHLSEEVIECLCACEPEPDRSPDERLRYLDECLDQLAPQARRAIELMYRQAHKPAEIARRLKWNAESVYVALSRARVILRDCVRRKMNLQEVT